jgi:hypothetical protein
MRLDSESWCCRQCGGAFIARKPDDLICRPCAASPEPADVIIVCRFCWELCSAPSDGRYPPCTVCGGRVCDRCGACLTALASLVATGQLAQVLKKMTGHGS